MYMQLLHKCHTVAVEQLLPKCHNDVAKMSLWYRCHSARSRTCGRGATPRCTNVTLPLVISEKYEISTIHHLTLYIKCLPSPQTNICPITRNSEWPTFANNARSQHLAKTSKNWPVWVAMSYCWRVMVGWLHARDVDLPLLIMMVCVSAFIVKFTTKHS